MARQKVPLQVNQFIGGLNTEASPLNFPPEASFDEKNMKVERDGSRSGRQGFDLEQFYLENATPVISQPGEVLGRSQFRWENAGGDPEAELMVVQIGNYIAVHNLTVRPVSSTPIFTKTFPVSTYSTSFGFADIDGALVIASGEKEVVVLSYDNLVITEESRTLYIRDFFGVEASISGDDLTTALGVQIRPVSRTDNHVYNLRNQTWGPPRVEDANTTTLKDCITEFFSSASAYPSNADSVTPFLFEDTSKTTDTKVKRFFHGTAAKTPPKSSKAPAGYFIIDALERGVSRLERVQNLNTTYSELGNDVTTLSADTTPGGPTVATEYAGRVWYAGFSGEVTGGDAHSPRMSSYILFSRLVRDPTEINLCYQEADPTSEEDPDVVATDGGFLKIDGAFNISALISLGTSLFVFAENGVWQVSGIDRNTFTATEFSVNRLGTEGAISGASVVLSKNQIAYWGESAIYGIEQDQFGSWQIVNITEKTIQTLYDGISFKDKESAIGYFDADNNSVRWVYGSDIDTRTKNDELILDLRYSAFLRNEILLPDDTVKGIISVSGASEANGQASSVVTVGGVDVTVSGDEVTVPTQVLDPSVTQSYYCVLLEFNGAVKYSFARYRRTDTYYDWASLGVGVDSGAYILTGPITAGDSRFRKDVPYLTTYFKQESAISSCLVSSRWDWTPTVAQSKWSTPREVYRPARTDNIDGITASRSRIRGGGRSVSFKFERNADAPLRLYGWDFDLQGTTEQ